MYLFNDLKYYANLLMDKDIIRARTSEENNLQPHIIQYFKRDGLPI